MTAVTFDKIFLKHNHSKRGALWHNSQAVDNKNEFLRRFYNNFRLSQGQLKTYATTPQCNAIIRNY
jgi:hypothetical protein